MSEDYKDDRIKRKLDSNLEEKENFLDSDKETDSINISKMNNVNESNPGSLMKYIESTFKYHNTSNSAISDQIFKDKNRVYTDIQNSTQLNLIDEIKGKNDEYIDFQPKTSLKNLDLKNQFLNNLEDSMANTAEKDPNLKQNFSERLESKESSMEESEF